MPNTPFYVAINEKSMRESLAQKINEESFSTDPLVKSLACIRHSDLDNFTNNTVKFRSHGIINLPPFGNTVVRDLTFPDNDLCDMSILRQSLNKEFIENQFHLDINSSDPTGDIQKDAVSVIGGYWRVQRRERILATLQAVIADSLKNHKSDLIIEEDLGSDLIASRIEIIKQAFRRMENDSKKPAAFIANPHDYIALEKYRECTSPQGDFMKDIPVINDDQLASSISADHTGATPAKKSYFSCLLGQGAFITGSGFHNFPIAGWHDPFANNGGGATFIISRVEWALHPRGYTCTLDSISNNQELKTAKTWERCWKRTHIPLMVIVTKQDNNY
jgi:hypothetical protein